MRKCLLSVMVVFLVANVATCFASQSMRGDSGVAYTASGTDEKYTNLVRQGMLLENQGKLPEALDKYSQASRIKRYEAESYYVLLDIGRVQYKKGAYAAATKTLTEFLKRIEIELKVQRSEIIPPDGVFIQPYTETGLKALLADMAEAEALLIASRSRLAR